MPACRLLSLLFFSFFFPKKKRGEKNFQRTFEVKGKRQGRREREKDSAWYSTDREGGGKEKEKGKEKFS